MDLLLPFGSWLCPLVLWRWGRVNNPDVDEHGRAAFRFHFSWFIYRWALISLLGAICLYLAFHWTDLAPAIGDALNSPGPQQSTQVHPSEEDDDLATDDDILQEPLDQAGPNEDQTGQEDQTEEEDLAKPEPAFPAYPDEEDKSKTPNIAAEPKNQQPFDSQFVTIEFAKNLFKNEVGLVVLMVGLIGLITFMWFVEMTLALINGFLAHTSNDLIYPLTLPFFKKRESGSSPPSL